MFYLIKPIISWGGVGFLKGPTGTYGSLAALPFVIGLVFLGGGWQVMLMASLVCYLIGVWTSGIYARHTGNDDPKAVVIDEVAGQFLTFVFCATHLSIFLLIAGFFLFRFFDITKIFPANWCENHLPDGWGIMTDDMIAGFYAAICLLGLDLSLYYIGL